MKKYLILIATSVALIFGGCTTTVGMLEGIVTKKNYIAKDNTDKQGCIYQLAIVLGKYIRIRTDQIEVFEIFGCDCEQVKEGDVINIYYVNNYNNGRRRHRPVFINAFTKEQLSFYKYRTLPDSLILEIIDEREEKGK